MGWGNALKVWLRTKLDALLTRYIDGRNSAGEYTDW